jgi:hypothetical protein
MKRQYLIFLAFFAACTKDKAPDEETPYKVSDTVNVIYMRSYNFARGFDTTDNYINDYDFLRKGLNAQNYIETYNLGSYTGSRSESKYHIRYTGEQPLFHPDSVIGRGGESIDFKINPALNGKTVFEVYDMNTGQVAKRYVASMDSTAIHVSFSLWDNFYVSNKQIGDAFLYYLRVKQTDAITYRKK